MINMDLHGMSMINMDLHGMSMINMDLCVSIGRCNHAHVAPVKRVMFGLTARHVAPRPAILWSENTYTPP